MTDSTYEFKLNLAVTSKSPEILDSLVDGNFNQILSAVLTNPNTSLKTLNKIADSGFLYYYVRHYLSIHPNTNEDLILKCRARSLSFRLNRLNK
jgi:hypothetical protein